MSVRCQCSESGCICIRVDRELDYFTSSWLVCLRCCLGRHVYPRHEHDFRCSSCGASAARNAA